MLIYLPCRQGYLKRIREEGEDMNKKAVRIICWVLAALMILSVLTITIAPTIF